ncbi:hypothetical protein BU24DRAFT_249585 [Aaosphaeria arxii CBS 175.79]|uniref:Uncharacterized protein n=1 Tax=Aaosphaeria arxii CBS 175.79 TaxID=1450172 RepID=A0A6A5XKV9_9PLEO|nr:uncharacterized protein BU24DRAFT_249585 [Aaosphaeria arxii CBS 175.79]KAF2013905.1 hypothetical protein BU24DRAFT_249585 [Aaosphaeria arxii CBS 175.79]
MDFVSISEISKDGPFPTLENVKFIWIYFLALIVMSIAVFGWWYYKRMSEANKSPTAAITEGSIEDQAESTIGLQPLHNPANETANRRQYNGKVLRQALDEFKNLGRSPEVSDEELSRAFKKIRIAKTALETGYDFDELWKSVQEADEQLGLSHGEA